MALSTVPPIFLITDKRPQKSFGQNTFLGIKRTNALNILEESIDKGLLEKSCEIAIDLHCSNSVDHIWTRIFNVIMPKINIDCPNLPYYLLKKYEEYEQAILCYKKCDLLNNRNNQQLRNLLCEVISTLTLSKKNTSLSIGAFPKLSDNDYKSEYIKKHVISSSLNIVKNFTYKNDSSEIILAMNEIANNMKNPNKDSLKNCFYWINWLLKLEKHNKIARQMFPLPCVERDIKNVPAKFCKDWVWVIWTIILKYAKTSSKSEGLLKQIKALYGIYKLDCRKTYAIGRRNQKFFIIYQAIYYIIMDRKISFNAPIVAKNKMCLRIQMSIKINKKYKKIMEKSEFSDNIQREFITAAAESRENNVEGDTNDFVGEDEEEEGGYVDFSLDQRHTVSNNVFDGFQDDDKFEEFEELEELIKRERGKDNDRYKREYSEFVRAKEREVKEPIEQKLDVDIAYKKKNKYEIEEEKRMQMENRTRYLDFVPKKRDDVDRLSDPMKYDSIETKMVKVI